MAQMTAAGGAMNLGPGHSVAAIGRGPHGLFQRLSEARPARPALELGAGFKQRLAAARAAERAGPLLLVERARSGALGPVLAQDRELLGRQGLPPVVLVLLHIGSFNDSSAVLVIILTSGHRIRVNQP